MKRKHPRTVGGWAAKYRREVAALRAAHAAEILRLEKKLMVEVRSLRQKLSTAEWEVERLRGIEAANFADYDRAFDETTSAERALFEASPAYVRYRQLRAAREELRPFTDAEKARRMLVAGNWRAP